MKNKSLSVFLVTLVLLVAIMFNFWCFDGAEKVATVINTRDRAVTLQAKITSTEYYTESDEGYETEYWEEKVTYTYNGVVYSGVLYDGASRVDEYGKVVSVKIDPMKPDELLPDNTDFLLSAIFSPLLLAGVIGVLHLQLTDITEHILDRRGKKNDKSVRTIVLSFIGIKLVAENIIFYINHNSAVFAIFTLIALAILGFFAMRKRKTKKENPEPQVETEILT